MQKKLFERLLSLTDKWTDGSSGAAIGESGLALKYHPKEACVGVGVPLTQQNFLLPGDVPVIYDEPMVLHGNEHNDGGGSTVILGHRMRRGRVHSDEEKGLCGKAMQASYPTA
ncbi:hypothetical protein ACFE04_027498 [Oxalis oulophora]